MLAEKYVASQALQSREARQAQKDRARAEKRRVRVTLAVTPAKTQEAREELPVNPLARIEHVETIAMRAVIANPADAVAAVIALFPANAPDYYHPDEDDATFAERRDPSKWLPATARLSEAECYAAARRAQAASGHRYGPMVTRLARVETASGQRAERTIEGHLSAIHQAAPDAATRDKMAEANITRGRGWTPIRMDLFPMA